MTTPINSKTIHRIFIASLFLKMFNAILEILAGFVFLFSGSITGLLVFLMKTELSEDPGDFIANLVRSWLPHLSAHSQFFAAFYLLIHGIVKIFVVIGLFSRKLWAHKAAIAVLVAFIAYQLYEYILSGSFWLILLSVFDTLLLWLTWREYQNQKLSYNKDVLPPHES